MSNDKKLEEMDLKELKAKASKLKLKFPEDVNEIGLVALISEHLADKNQDAKSEGEDGVKIDSPKSDDGKSDDGDEPELNPEDEVNEKVEAQKKADADKKVEEKEKADAIAKKEADKKAKDLVEKAKIEKINLDKNNAPNVDKEDKGVKVQITTKVPSIQVGGQRFSFPKGFKGTIPTGIAGHLIRTGVAIKL